MISLWLVLLGLAVVLVSLLVVRMHAFLALILAAMVVALATPLSQGLPTADAPAKVMNAFGDTCGKMGLLIAMAAIIGKCLLDSGAAMRIVQAILSLFGQARAHIAFVFTGFFLAIPVFFDAVFYCSCRSGRRWRRAWGRTICFIS